MMKPAAGIQNGFVLRLSLPASGELAVVGPEMAAKLAEQLGLDASQAAHVSATLGELGRQVEGAGSGDVAFEFHKADTELRIEARQDDRAAEARVPLHA